MGKTREKRHSDSKSIERLKEKYEKYKDKCEKYKSMYESMNARFRSVWEDHEKLQAEVEALRTQLTMREQLGVDTETLVTENKDLKLRIETLSHLLPENETLRKKVQELQAELDRVKATNQQEIRQLKETNEELWAENTSLKKENEELKKQEMKLKLDNFVNNKLCEELKQENEKLKKGTMFDELNSSLQILRDENEELRNELLKLKEDANERKTQAAPDDEEENEYAVRLNDHWNSLSLGKDMYDSLFSFKVETPHVWPDPLVWNIVYAAVPPEYAIPDPDFTNELTRNVAWGMLKPTLSRSLSYDEFLESFKDVSEKASSPDPDQTRE
jgi:chromosome segregation ATPase